MVSSSQPQQLSSCLQRKDPEEPCSGTASGTLRQYLEDTQHENNIVIKAVSLEVFTELWPIRKVRVKIQDMHHNQLVAKTKSVIYFGFHFIPRWPHPVGGQTIRHVATRLHALVAKSSSGSHAARVGTYVYLSTTQFSSLLANSNAGGEKVSTNDNSDRLKIFVFSSCRLSRKESGSASLSGRTKFHFDVVKCIYFIICHDLDIYTTCLFKIV